MLLSVVIPTYRSQSYIAQTFRELEEFARLMSYQVEVIFVDDGSEDGTFNELCRLAECSQLKVKVIQLFTNRGQHRAILAGLTQARGGYVVTWDDDLEYHPSQMLRLLAPVEAEPGRWDVVIGVPEIRRRSIFRRWGSGLNNLLNTIMFNKPRRLKSGSFRLLTADFAKRLREFQTANPVLGALIFRATKRVLNVPVEHQRGLRPSNYTPGRLIRTLSRGLQSFSEFPLRYIAWGGFLLAFISFAAALFVVIQYLTGWPWPIRAPGWTSLIVVLCFFSGAILFSVGFIGQYVFRVLEEVNKSPNYQIRTVFESPQPRENAAK